MALMVKMGLALGGLVAGLVVGMAVGMAAGAAPAAIEEIVVTTQKRAQAARDVPVSLTAYDGDFLDAIGVAQFDELSLFVPGLTVQEQSPNNPGFVMRGITSDSGSAQDAPRVSIYLNGVDVSRSRGSYFELHDIARVETVKGPQATLFGTAAAIGAISVITNPPTPEWSAAAQASYGNFDAARVTGFVNGGSATLAGRLAY
ncbi:MAG: TonB-dependent receptor, partial [Alphaproteobacteria bacterium]